MKSFNFVSSMGRPISYRIIKMRRFIVLILILIVLCPVIAKAQGVDYCFEEAGRMYGIAPELLQAISKHESGHNPYAINRNPNGTYDYGHMQINSWWYGVLGHDLWMSLSNPCQSTKVGAWILAQCIRRYGYTWQAVGCYNAKSEHKRKKYAWKIYNILLRSNANSTQCRNDQSCTIKQM